MDNNSRIIGKYSCGNKGPLLFITAGVHGNEPAGVLALQKVFGEIEKKKGNINGSIYGLAGILWALKRGVRYHKVDLNRLWTSIRMQRLEQNNLAIDNEDTKQQIEILEELNIIIEKDEGPFYFLDLHTTSSQTAPFLTVNDSLLNRKFAELYPSPMILGIEEYLSGPLLSYINEMGYVSFGFEGGQHDDVASVHNHEAFIYLSLVFAGSLSKDEVDYDRHYRKLAQESEHNMGVYEIYFRYQISTEEKFEMKAGYSNFQYIKKGEVLAKSNGDEVLAEHSSRIFMPLYQSQGEDGFFAIRPIRSILLKLSEFVRKKRLDRILPYLPGVKWASKKRDTLILNKRVAKFMAKEVMHLMGYRSRYFDRQYLYAKNREAASRNADYKNEDWYLERF